MKPLRNPIYDAPLKERLVDIQRTISMAMAILESPGLSQVVDPKAEELEPGEVAIGNWIIRPRFK